MQAHEPNAPRQSLWLLALSLAAVLVVSSFFLFWRLGSKPLENWDEGIHAEVTREMYHQGSWISLSYRDQFYTAKPPLKFWITAPLLSLMGDSELAMRLWSAVAGVATTLLITYWIWLISGSARLSILAGVLFVTGRFVLFHAFRTGETDGLLVALFTAALFAYWKSREAPRWFLAFGVLVGLCLMTKSFAGFLPPLIVGIDLTLGRRWSRLGLRTVLLAAGAAALIAVPWHAFELVRHGAAFWNSYFGFHVLDRASDVLYANNVSWHWYADVLFKRTFPFGVFIPIAFVIAVRRAIRDRDELDRLLIIWIVIVFGVFSLVRTKFDWYLLPLYPALIIIVARAITDFLHQRLSRPFVLAALASFAAGMYVLPLGIAHEGVLWQLTPFAYLPDGASGTVIGRTAVACLVTAVVIAVTSFLRSRTVVKPSRLAGMAVVLYFAVMALGWQFSYLRHLPTTSPLKDIAARIDELNVSEVDVVGVNLLTQPAGYFYLRRVPGLTVSERVSIDDIRTSFVLTDTAWSPYDLLLSQGDVILQREHFVLLERSPRMPL